MSGLIDREVRQTDGLMDRWADMLNIETDIKLIISWNTLQRLKNELQQRHDGLTLTQRKTNGKQSLPFHLEGQEGLEGPGRQSILIKYGSQSWCAFLYQRYLQVPWLAR